VHLPLCQRAFACVLSSWPTTVALRADQIAALLAWGCSFFRSFCQRAFPSSMHVATLVQLDACDQNEGPG
jgi:hypothetical protein